MVKSLQGVQANEFQNVKLTFERKFLQMIAPSCKNSQKGIFYEWREDLSTKFQISGEKILYKTRK